MEDARQDLNGVAARLWSFAFVPDGAPTGILFISGGGQLSAMKSFAFALHAAPTELVNKHQNGSTSPGTATIWWQRRRLLSVVCLKTLVVCF